MLNLEKLHKTQTKYNSQKEEVVDKFYDANNWLGLKMEMEEVRKYTWNHKTAKKESDHTILYGDAYKDDREEAITAKLEQSAWINKKQIVINDFYFTTAGGLIALVNLGKVMVREVHNRAIRASSKHFRTINYTPKLARDRQTSLDKILLDFKKVEPDFRYLIKNDKEDLSVLVKRSSEQQHMPFRKYNLKNLGSLSPLKPLTPLSEEEKLNEAASD